MNERLIKRTKELGISQYSLAKMVGVPFSTINGLFTERRSINHCAAATVIRIASLLGCPPAELLDDYDMVPGTIGFHDDIRYEWIKKKDGMYIRYKDSEGEVVDVRVGSHQNFRFPGNQDYYPTTVKWAIEDHEDELRFQREAELLLEKA